MLHTDLWQSRQLGISTQDEKWLPKNKQCMGVSRSRKPRNGRNTWVLWNYIYTGAHIQNSQSWSVSQSSRQKGLIFREWPGSVQRIFQVAPGGTRSSLHPSKKQRRKALNIDSKRDLKKKVNIEVLCQPVSEIFVSVFLSHLQPISDLWSNKDERDVFMPPHFFFMPLYNN